MFGYQSAFVYFKESIVTAKMIIIAPKTSQKPKVICKKIIDKIMDENGSKEAKTLILVGERYLVLSKQAQKAIAVPKIITLAIVNKVSISHIP